MEYNPRSIEKKWQAWWQENNTYKVPTLSEKPKFYVLDMFPYPSGSGLHVGHPLGYIASDIFTRYKRLKGFNVLHPMGYDAFGLPAEQYAIDNGIHPAVSTATNIERYREQLDNLGLSFDWSREVQTCDPAYYKWTQWIFLQIFGHYYDTAADKALPISDLIAVFEKEGNKNVQATTSQTDTFTAADWNAYTPKQKDEVLMNYRLMFRTVGYVNWCEALGTVLANDEVSNGLSERGGHPVEIRPMLQWSMRITAYAERLLAGLDAVDFPEALKAMQRNWIGRSEGAQIFFDIEDHDGQLEIYTTRADTIFGATFMVLAPEHDLVEHITTEAQQNDIDAYLKYASSRSERERMADNKSTTGAFTGAFALNPFTGKKVPIWISDYVLKGYGTGAIMAVPADDERDLRFAEKFGLEVVPVIDKSMYPQASMEDKLGKMVNSEFLNGMEVKDAIIEITKRLEAKAIGKKKINYRLRDANYSRQRYWGEPIPIIYDADGVAYPMVEDELPLVLPTEVKEYRPQGGRGPLAALEDWVNLPNGFTRETDTMPGFAGSSWYFLRYMDANNTEKLASKAALDYWQDVDFYIGGAEHAVGHLMYSRMWHKFLKDIGRVPTEEPYKKLVNQGMIQGMVENMYLLREKTNGSHHFLCSKLAELDPELDYVPILVHADFIKNYGSMDSYLDAESIQQFIDWRPEYADAIFECGKGVYQSGTFKARQAGATDSHLLTHTEVGKMSKRLYNVINPDDISERYGTDCFRMYEMFLGPIEMGKPWDTNGISGVSNFLRRFWAIFFDKNEAFNLRDEAITRDENRIVHTCIKKVSEDIERFSMNTCVSHFMVATNELKKLHCNKRAALEPIVVLLAPFAPHIAEELWSMMGKQGSVCDAEWPTWDEEALVTDEVVYPIQINGKRRAEVSFPTGTDKATIEKAIMQMDVVLSRLEGKTPKKLIVVPGRIINIVV